METRNVKMNPPHPCFECKDRAVGCGASCEAWKDYERKRADKYKKNISGYSVKSYFADKISKSNKEKIAVTRKRDAGYKI